MGAAIRQIVSYFPETVLDNVQLAQEFGELKVESIEDAGGGTRQIVRSIEEKIGVRDRHIVRSDETALDLAIGVSEKLWESYDKNRIDYILFCTMNPDYRITPNACLLQDHLGLRTSVAGLDYTMACSGYIYGLSLAKGVIAAGIAQNVLLITAETGSKMLHPRDKVNRAIFGDGAAATVIERSDDDRILNFVLGTDGKGFDKLYIPRGGARAPIAPAASNQDGTLGEAPLENYFFMDGPEVFNFSIEVVPPLIADVLQKNNLTLDQVDYVVFHQANKSMLAYLRKKLKIPPEKFYLDMLHVGNTVAPTIPIALRDALDQGIIAPGKTVLLAGFGAGYSWGATIIKL